MNNPGIWTDQPSLWNVTYFHRLFSPSSCAGLPSPEIPCWTRSWHFSTAPGIFRALFVTWPKISARLRREVWSTLWYNSRYCFMQQCLMPIAYKSQEMRRCIRGDHSWFRKCAPGLSHMIIFPLLFTLRTLSRSPSVELRYYVRQHRFRAQA